MNWKRSQKNFELCLLVENGRFLRGHYKMNVLNGTRMNLGRAGRIWEEMES